MVIVRMRLMFVIEVVEKWKMYCILFFCQLLVCELVVCGLIEFDINLDDDC